MYSTYSRLNITVHDSWRAVVRAASRKLSYVSAVSSFTCSLMRADGFGGMVVVISPIAILGKSTNDLLEEFIEQVMPSADS